MKLKTLIALTLAFWSATASAETISPAKAVELTCHRLERLVQQKKIPSSFLTLLSSIGVQPVRDSAPINGAFITTSRLGEEEGNTKSSMTFDSAGKVLNFEVVEGTAPHDPAIWPETDALGLIEVAMHYVVDHGARQPELQPFNSAMTGIFLSRAMSDSGKLMARLEVRTSAPGQILEILLAPNGQLISANVLP